MVTTLKVRLVLAQKVVADRWRKWDGSHFKNAIQVYATRSTLLVGLSATTLIYANIIGQVSANSPKAEHLYRSASLLKS